MPMEFENQAQEALHARVTVCLAQAFGELAEPLESDEPAFWLSLGKAGVLITVDANGPEMASAMVLIQLAEGLPITPTVGEFLARKNHELPFGALTIGDDDIISYRHILFGECVTKDTLAILIRVMASSSEAIEDELNMRFR
jgi:hypothetical protein